MYQNCGSGAFCSTGVSLDSREKTGRGAVGGIATSKVCHSDVNHSQGAPPCPGGLNSVTSLSTPHVNAEQVPRPTPRGSGRGGISHFEGR